MSSETPNAIEDRVFAWAGKWCVYACLETDKGLGVRRKSRGERESGKPSGDEPIPRLRFCRTLQRRNCLFRRGEDQEQFLHTRNLE